jgi:DNA-directed RNA polymerase specialized sigma24 family protein
MANDTIGSVSKWILGARQGDPVAIDQIVSRYLARLATSARLLLRDKVRQPHDGEDIAADVLMQIAEELSSGKHRRLCDREGLWVLLIAIVDKQVVQLREVRRRQNESIPQELPLTEYLFNCDQDLELMLSKANRHGDLQAVLDQMDDLISMFRDKQSREIASRKLQGYSNREIGAQLGLVSKTVDRKVAKIEARWKQYMDNDRRDC